MIYMIYITHKGKTYQIDQIDGELRQEAFNRLWKIIQKSPQNDYQLEQLIRLSEMWYYRTKMGCRYAPELEKQIIIFQN